MALFGGSGYGFFSYSKLYLYGYSQYEIFLKRAFNLSANLRLTRCVIRENRFFDSKTIPHVRYSRIRKKSAFS